MSASNRIPKVIPINTTDDATDDEEEVGDYFTAAANRRSSNIMQRILGVANELSFGPRSGSPSELFMASNSDDNALFDSDQDQEDMEVEQEQQQQGQQQQQQATVENEEAAAAVAISPPQDAHENTDQRTEPMQVDNTVEPPVATLPVHVNDRIETLMETCTEFIKANKYTNNWAVNHGCAFYMSKRFHCYYMQGRDCKASFDNSDLLTEHLSSAHHVLKHKILQSAHQMAVDRKLARWIIADNMPMLKFVGSEFDLIVRVIQDMALETLPRNNGEEQSAVYSVSQSRLEKIIKAEHQTISSELSERLKTMEHLSVVVHQWEGTQHASMLVFSVFFMDQEWNKKSYVVAAEPLDASESHGSILQKMGIVFLDLGIIDKIYSITCQGIQHLNAEAVFTFMQKISSGRRTKLAQERIYTQMLDQVITEMRIELLSSLRFDCEPLKTILNGLDSCNCTAALKETQSNTIGLMQAYLDNKKNHHIGCSLELCGISEADKECMSQVIKLDRELAFIDDWLHEAAEKNMTIANKAYVICCELGKSVKALAELKNSRRAVAKTSTSKNYEIAEAVNKADYMKKPLEAMHTLLSAYRTQIENGRGHVEAFVYDSYAYNDDYFRVQSRTPTLVKQLRHINLLLEDIAEHEPKRYRGNDITELLKLNTEEKQQFDDPNVATSSSSNIITTKRRRSNNSTVIQEPPSVQPFSYQVQLLQQKQVAYFKKYPDTKFRDQPRIMTILSEQAVGGQINFWRQESDERLSVLMDHTKKTFAIPTTAQECIQSVNQFKREYLLLANQEPDVHVELTCHRALLYCWSMDFTLFKD